MGFSNINHFFWIFKYISWFQWAFPWHKPSILGYVWATPLAMEPPPHMFRKTPRSPLLGSQGSWELHVALKPSRARRSRVQRWRAGKALKMAGKTATNGGLPGSVPTSKTIFYELIPEKDTQWEIKGYQHITIILTDSSRNICPCCSKSITSSTRTCMRNHLGVEDVPCSRDFRRKTLKTGSKKHLPAVEYISWRVANMTTNSRKKYSESNKKTPSKVTTSLKPQNNLPRNVARLSGNFLHSGWINYFDWAKVFQFANCVRNGRVSSESSRSLGISLTKTIHFLG